MKKLALLLTVCFAPIAHAAAPSVAVANTSVAGNSVTVNTVSAHGFVVNQGFCLTLGPQCGVIASVPTSTSFTFTLTGQTACSTNCGMATPAPQVIVLSVQPAPGGVNYNLLFWLTTQNPVAGPPESQWKAANGSAGPTAAQLNAIAAGYFIETPFPRFEPSTASLPQIEADVQNLYGALQSVQAGGTQPGSDYGFIYTPQGGWTQQ